MLEGNFQRKPRATCPGAHASRRRVAYTCVIQQTGADQIIYDFRFAVTPIPPVPTSSRLGLVLLAGVLAAGGFLAVRGTRQELGG